MGTDNQSIPKERAVTFRVSASISFGFLNRSNEENEGPNDFVAQDESEGYTQRRKERGDSVN